MAERGDIRHGFLHERFVGDVADVGAVGVIGPLRGQFGLTFGIEVDTGHQPAVGDELAGELVAQAQRAAGDDGDFLTCCGWHGRPLLLLFFGYEFTTILQLRVRDTNHSRGLRRRRA